MNLVALNKESTDESYEARRDSHENCILCGHNNPASLGLVFQKTGQGSVTATFAGRPLLQGYNGILHGGIIASLLDAAMTHCLFHEGVRAVTASLNIRYVKSVPCNARLRIYAHIKEAYSNMLYHMEAEMVTNGEVVAHANAKFMPQEEPLAAPVETL